MTGRMTYNAHGIAPSVCTLTLPPQAVTQAVGRLEFVDPERGTFVRFENCLVDSVSATGGGSQATILRARILDERWSWQNRWIRGAYNLRLANGNVDPKTSKTPRQLATLLLRAMGVASYDVNGLPNEGESEAIWDYASPASELQKLVDSLGCRVVRELSGKVVLRRLGEGKELPPLPNAQIDFTIDPTNLTSELMLVCAPTEWQREYELEAVAEEHPGGKFVPLDEVSYTPPDGWESEDPQLFSIPEEVEPPEDKPTDLDLAQASVFRAYRIKESNEFPEEAEFQHILPISSEILEEEDDERTGRKVRKPAFVRGVFFDGRVTLDNTSENQRVKIPFAVREDLGIVMFSSPVYRYDEEGRTLPAQLKLTCSHQILDVEDRLPKRATFKQRVPNAPPAAGVKIMEHNEINLQVKPKEDNEQELKRQAEYYLRAELEGQQKSQAGSIVTQGIIAVEPDGAIQQISWACGSNTLTTTSISRNTEIDPYTVPYKVRQKSLEQREEAQQAALERRRALREKRR